MDAAPPAPRRVPWPALAAGLIAFLAAARVVSDELGSMGGDSAEYVLLSKALREGIGYRTTWAPGEPAPHTLYPPVWPVLLLPFAGAAPASFLGAHLLLAVLSGAAVFVLARLFERRGLPAWAAAAGTLVPALSLHWLRCTADLLSEIPSLLFAALALLFADPGEGDRLPPRRIVLAAAFAGLAFLTRTAGLALVVPLAAALCLDPRARGRTAWIAAAVLAAACGAWFLYGGTMGAGSTSYAAQLAGGGDGPLARAWRELVGFYLPGTPSYVFPHPGPFWEIAGWALWAPAAVGLVAGIRRRRGLAVAEGFFLAWLAMQSFWPYRDFRFALPLAALMVPFALEGAWILGKRAPAAAWVALGLGVALLVPNGVRYFTHWLPRSQRERPAAAPGEHEPAGFERTWWWSNDEYRQAAPALAAFLHACDLVREGASGIPPGPVMASNPRVAALLCGRPAVKAPEGASPADLAALARETGVAVVIADGFGGGGSPALRAWRDAGTGELERIVALPGGVQVLRVRR